MISLLKLSLIDNKYCLLYAGFNVHIISEINQLRQIIEGKYSDILFFICCRDELLYLLDKHPRNINISNYIKNDYAVTYTMLETPGVNPVNEFKRKM